MNQFTLTREQFERASRREGISHPVISVIEYHEPRISHLKGYAVMDGNQEQQKYIAGNFGFLGDAFEEADDFSLGPLDLVAIWSKVLEIWPDDLYPRYGLAKMLLSAYGIQGKPDFRGLSRYFLETRELSEGLARDKSGLVYVKGRLKHIDTSLAELDSYVSGTKESAVELAAKLAQRIRDGDEEARRELEQVIALHKERSTPILEALGENLGTGLLSFSLAINDALDKLE